MTEDREGFLERWIYLGLIKIEIQAKGAVEKPHMDQLDFLLCNIMRVSFKRRRNGLFKYNRNLKITY